MTEDDARRLFRLLFDAREQVAVWGDVVAARTGRLPA